MKKFLALVLVSATASLIVAQNAADKKPAAAADAKSIAASEAKLTAPMALKDGAISQPAQTDVSAGGKAVFEFTVPKDGDYVVHAVVSAPDDDNNSFYVNVDKAPTEDPLMIWDIDLTSGFEERIVNWRGNGEAGADEFNPKVFKLTAGAHKLYLVGREPAKLKSVSIRAATK